MAVMIPLCATILPFSVILRRRIKPEGGSRGSQPEPRQDPLPLGVCGVHEGRRERVIAARGPRECDSHVYYFDTNKQEMYRLKCSYTRGASRGQQPTSTGSTMVQSRRHQEKLDRPQVHLCDKAVRLRGCLPMRPLASPKTYATGCCAEEPLDFLS